MPITQALSRSDCKAMRLRSRQVIWKMGSRPPCTHSAEVTSEPSLITELCWSVTLAASTLPLRISMFSLIS